MGSMAPSLLDILGKFVEVWLNRRGMQRCISVQFDTYTQTMHLARLQATSSNCDVKSGHSLFARFGSA